MNRLTGCGGTLMVLCLATLVASSAAAAATPELAMLAHVAMASRAPTARVAEHVASPSHTATTRHRHRWHRHRHHPQPASLAANHTRPLRPTAPATPGPQRPDHRAKLPARAYDLRQWHASKASARRAAMPSAGCVMLLVTSRVLEARQNQAPEAREHPVTSGRGPPRGSPTREAPASRRLTPASAPPFDSPPASRRPLPTTSRVNVACRPVRACSRPDLESRWIDPLCRFPRPAPGRLHAVRREGATACSSMPSNGGAPCPA